MFELDLNTKLVLIRHLSQHEIFELFTDVGSSETQMCRLARAFAVRVKRNLPFEPITLPGGTCSLVPLGLQYCLCSPFFLKIWPLSPCILEINSLFPLFPKTPRGDIRHITNFRFWRTVEEAKLFQGNKDTIGEQAREHKKTNFRFLGNRGTSQIISEEQRNRYPRPRSVLPCTLGPKSIPGSSSLTLSHLHMTQVVGGT